MDITDFEDDARAGIETVPVRHGRGAASAVALGCSVVSAVSATGASLAPCIGRLAGAGGGGGGGGEGYILGWRNNSMMTGLASSLTALAMSPGVRRVLLSAAGSAMLVRRTYGVWRTKGEDSKLADRAVEESLISVLLVLASFL